MPDYTPARGLYFLHCCTWLSW